MWQSLAENSALLLGLAISVYTVCTFIETRINQHRQRYALLRSLRLQAEYFIDCVQFRRRPRCRRAL